MIYHRPERKKERKSKSIFDYWRLDETFERRYVIGQVLLFLPCFSAVLAVISLGGKAPIGFFFLKYGLFLVLMAGGSYASARKARPRIEETREAEFDPAWHHALGIFGGIAAVSVIVAAEKGEMGWVLRVLGLGVLLALGLWLRWLVYDRWLKAELAEAPPPDGPDSNLWQSE
jgi:hypothetical protein